MNIEEILTHLPHRYPFVMVDRILELEPLKHVKALKNVTINEPYFMGHFPGHPVMPGAMMMEALAQAAIFVFAVLPEFDQDSVYYLTGIHNAKFRRKVIPGDQLILQATLARHLNTMAKFSGVATVDGQLAVEMEFMCMCSAKPIK